MLLPHLADSAPTPAALLDEVRAARSAADAAERLVLQLAVEWAHSHPVLDGGDRSWCVPATPGFSLSELDEAAALAADEEGVEWFSIPPVAWDAPAGFAAANRMSEVAGKALLRDALVLCHRMPLVWARVGAGQVPAWRARRIAQAVLGLPADVVSSVDHDVAPVAETVGVRTLDRLVEETRQRLYAEQRELESLEALEMRHVTLHDGSISHTGVADLTIRGDWKDLHDFDAAVAAVAAALRARGSEESLDVRRAMAVGILADPDQARALLEGSPATEPRKQVVLYFHVSDDAVQGHDPVGRNATTGRPELEQLIREWCGRSDTHLTVTPVVDLTGHEQVDAYEVPDRLRAQTTLLHGTCVYPWCTRPARRCDCDHGVPYAAGGATCSCNLAPLCRHHHLLKTHTPWSYRRIDRTTFLWTDPFGHHYLRDRGQTVVLPPDPRHHQVA